MDRGRYPGVVLMRKVWILGLAVHLGIVSLGVLGSFLAARVILRRWGFIRKLIKGGGGVAITILLLVLAFQDGEVGWKEMAVIDLAVGMTIGTFLTLLHLKKRNRVGGLKERGEAA